MDYIEALLNVLYTPLSYLSSPGERIYLPYLLTSLIIAILVERRNHAAEAPLSEAVGGIFPRKIYTHSSSIVDYVYFLSNSILYLFILLPFGGFSLVVTQYVTELLSSVATPTASIGPVSVWVTVLVTLLMAMVADFGTFFAHVLMHRIPLLWEFHKVHHSAQVMTPLTVYRMHPLDDGITLVITGSLIGTADALFRFFVSAQASPYVIAGLSIVTVLFYVFGYNLRHSHVWVSYGPVLSKILISPAQHQIHHSAARQHWNKNYGFVFAIWDYLFKSLYVPKEREKIEFGIGRGEDREYSSPLRLYMLPFLKAGRLLLKKKKRAVVHPVEQASKNR
jgi:sterol desaturase/sphingolipid hydroxylase (fatty acid hydroxylase superfamily)